MALEQIPIIELVWKLATNNMDHISRVTYTPQKPPYTGNYSVKQPFPRISPEEQGVSSEKMAEMLLRLANGEETNMHQFMMIKNGAVIAECGFAPYQRGLWHASYSMCKSITGMAIGMLITEGLLSLDTKVLDIFHSERTLMSRLRHKDLTIEHLLTMTSGSSYNEIGAISGDEWVKGFFEGNLHSAPGEKFEYNSMNSYILSAIVTEITGQPMIDYLRERLWEPLDIKDVFWESCPNGITKGGWGLFICPEDAGKLGQLYLQRGIWNGAEIIPGKWIEESVKNKTQVPEEMGLGGYGYQIWEGNTPESYLFNGMLGQNVLVYPEYDMVIVTNAGNSTFFQRCEMLDIICNMVCDESFYTKSKSKKTSKKLKKTIAQLEDTAPKKRLLIDGYKVWKKEKVSIRRAYRGLEQLEGKLYKMDEVHVGIFPLLLQLIHNNYSKGIERIQIYERNQEYYLLMEEGVNTHKIKLGINEWEQQDIDLHGESYKIATRVIGNTNEDDQLVLKFNFAFLEDAATRTMKIILDDSTTDIKVAFNETPGKKIMFQGLDGFMDDIVESTHPLVRGIKERGIFDLLFRLFGYTVEPEINAKLQEK